MINEVIWAQKVAEKLVFLIIENAACPDVIYKNFRYRWILFYIFKNGFYYGMKSLVHLPDMV